MGQLSLLQLLLLDSTLHPSHLSSVVLLSKGEGQGVGAGPSDSPGQGLGGEDQGCELPTVSAKPRRCSSAATEVHTASTV